MWKLTVSNNIINSAQAATFHLSDLLSTHRPVEAMLEIRTTGALGNPLLKDPVSDRLSGWVF